jgi:CRISPR system Cascade subunit CasD
MNQYLVFQLRGDMASWGDIAVGEQRPSLIFPTKSAIVGLISAALGIKRDEEEKHVQMSGGIRYGARISPPQEKIVGYNNEFFGNDQTYSGSYLRDFHTIQSASKANINDFVKRNNRRPVSRYEELLALKMGKPTDTILSYREYRLDAYYSISIEIKKPLFVSLQEIKNALTEPKFHLYLGRKSCPVNLPLCPHIVEADGHVNAHLQANFKGGEDHVKADKSIFYLEESEDIENVNWIEEEYRAVPLSRSRWQFGAQKIFVCEKEDEECI